MASVNSLAVDLSFVKSSNVNVLFESASRSTGSISSTDLSIVYFPINQGQGFELRGYSDHNLIQVVVMDASSPGEISISLLYRGNSIATGTLTPCQKNELCGQTPAIISK